MTIDPRLTILLTFWFGDFHLDKTYFEERNKLWFGKSSQNDSYIRTHFSDDLTKALAGNFKTWTETPKGSLGLSFY